MKDLGYGISKNRKLNKLSQAELAEKMHAFGFAPSSASVSSWEKNVSIPNASQFLAICNILGIQDIYNEFIEDQTVGILAGLNEEGIQKVKEYAELLKNSEKYSDVKKDIHITKSIGKNTKTARKVTSIRKKSESVEVIRIYNLPVSAGTGEFLDGEDYEEVNRSEDIPSRADFGLRIKGNSMEPRYKDGQKVWIKKCSSLEDGDIGIFLLDGNAYCKKLSLKADCIQLISLNKNYAPIEVRPDSTLVTFGKVLN